MGGHLSVSSCLPTGMAMVSALRLRPAFFGSPLKPHHRAHGALWRKVLRSRDARAREVLWEELQASETGWFRAIWVAAPNRGVDRCLLGRWLHDRRVVRRPRSGRQSEENTRIVLPFSGAGPAVAPEQESSFTYHFHIPHTNTTRKESTKPQIPGSYR